MHDFRNAFMTKRIKSAEQGVPNNPQHLDHAGERKLLSLEA